MIVVALQTLISLAGLWALYWLYQDYRNDWVRQQLFALRDRLFDFAEQGGLPFDHRAYGLMRTTINGYIRFAHRVRLLTALSMYFSLRRLEVRIFGERSFPAAFERAVKDLPEETQKKLRRFRDEMHMLVGKHLVFSSVFLMLVGLVLAVLATIIQGLGRTVANALNLAADVIDVAAHNAGESPRTAGPAGLIVQFGR